MRGSDAERSPKRLTLSCVEPAHVVDNTFAELILDLHARTDGRRKTVL